MIPPWLRPWTLVAHHRPHDWHAQLHAWVLLKRRFHQTNWSDIYTPVRDQLCTTRHKKLNGCRATARRAFCWNLAKCCTMYEKSPLKKPAIRAWSVLMPFCRLFPISFSLYYVSVLYRFHAIVTHLPTFKAVTSRRVCLRLHDQPTRHQHWSAELHLF